MNTNPQKFPQLFVSIRVEFVRRLRLGRAQSSSSTLIALIKLLLRLRSHARIGVRAGRRGDRVKKEEEALQRKLRPSIHKPYELTNHLPHSHTALDTLHRG